MSSREKEASSSTSSSGASPTPTAREIVGALERRLLEMSSIPHCSSDRIDRVLAAMQQRSGWIVEPASDETIDGRRRATWRLSQQGAVARVRLDGDAIYVQRVDGSDRPPTDDSPSAEDLLARLRADGWSVAVHNDYRQNGERKTFWVMTRSRYALKGEGSTDAEALEAIASAARANRSLFERIDALAAADGSAIGPDGPETSRATTPAESEAFGIVSQHVYSALRAAYLGDASKLVRLFRIAWGSAGALGTAILGRAEDESLLAMLDAAREAWLGIARHPAEEPAVMRADARMLRLRASLLRHEPCPKHGIEASRCGCSIGEATMSADAAQSEHDAVVSDEVD